MAETPPEAMLLDEPTATDLAAKVAEAWREFARALAEAIPNLPPGCRLEITLDPTASGTGAAMYRISLCAGEGGAVAVFAVSNADLPEEYRLDRGAVADLVALGWAPPRVLPGSGNRFGLAGQAADATRLAALVSRAFRDIYGAPHPAFLTYTSEIAGEPADMDITLAAARPLPRGAQSLDNALAVWNGEPRSGAADGGEDSDEAPLDLRVAAVVAQLMNTAPDALQVDADGDISIRAGSAMVFVRVRDNPPLIDVFSPVLTEIEPTERLYTKLSELTNRMPIGRLYCTDGTVWASVPVFGRDFQPTHLMLAVQVMTGLADELDDRLQGEFGGKRFFGESDRPDRPGSGLERTGMYL